MEILDEVTTPKPIGMYNNKQLYTLFNYLISENHYTKSLGYFR